MEQVSCGGVAHVVCLVPTADQKARVDKKDFKIVVEKTRAHHEALRWFAIHVSFPLMNKCGLYRGGKSVGWTKLPGAVAQISIGNDGDIWSRFRATCSALIVQCLSMYAGP